MTSPSLTLSPSRTRTSSSRPAAFGATVELSPSIRPLNVRTLSGPDVRKNPLQTSTAATTAARSTTTRRRRRERAAGAAGVARAGGDSGWEESAICRAGIMSRHLPERVAGTRSLSSTGAANVPPDGLMVVHSFHEIKSRETRCTSVAGTRRTSGCVGSWPLSGHACHEDNRSPPDVLAGARAAAARGTSE
jgi:hypothetical protein